MLAALVLGAWVLAQEARPPSERECQDLIAEYVELRGAAPRGAEILARLDELGPLSAAEARTWRKRVLDAAQRGEKLRNDGGEHALADGRTYYVGGKIGKPKGILIHLHGGRTPTRPPDRGAPDFLAASRLDWVVVMPRRLDGESWVDPGSTQLVNDVLDAALRTWRVDPERVFLAGTSAGAIGGWRHAARFADRFAGFAAFSGGIAASASGSDELADGVVPNLRNLPAVFFHAVDDRTVPVAGSRAAALRLRLAGERWGGFPHRYDEVLGTKHGPPLGGPGPQYEWLAEHGSRALPERVVWQPEREGPGDGRHYWLAWPAPPAGIIVTVDLDREANAVHVTGGGAWDGLEILLRDDMLEFERREVVVTAGGAEVYRGIPERRLSVLLRTGARGDATCTYEAAVALSDRTRRRERRIQSKSPARPRRIAGNTTRLPSAV